jgi:hypothetical protein
MNKGLYLFLLLCGIGLLVYAVQQMQTVNYLVENGVKTTATLVEIKKTTDINGMDMFQPIFEFQDGANQTVRFPYEQMSAQPQWAVGQKLTLVYNPKNTAQAALEKGWDLGGTQMILLALGLILSIFGFKKLIMG